jgi:hypothetical protein
MSLTNTDLQSLPQPNVYTAMGALCLDSTIRREFFHPETPPVQDLFLNLDETEFQTCMSLASDKTAKPPESDYAALGALFCRRPPCPYAIPNIETVLGAAVLDERFRAAWFKDPHKAHLDYGFDLLEEEDAILVDILSRKGKKIQEKVENLGRKLKQVMSVTPLATLSEVATAIAKAKAA